MAKNYNSALSFELLANAQQFNSELRKARGQFSNFVGGLNKLAGVAAGGFLVGEFANLAGTVVSTRAEFSKLEKVLANTLGSDSQAAVELDRLSKFSRDFAQSTEDVTTAYIKLTNRGLKPTQEQLKNLLDLASASGKSLDQVAEAVLDGVVGENERLKELGVRAKDAGDTVQFTFRGITTEVQKSESALRDYLFSLGQVEGVAGATEAVSKSLAGQITAFEGSVTELRNEIGKLVEDEGASFLSFLTDTSNELTKFLKQINSPAGRFSNLVDTDGSIAEQEKNLTRLLIKQEQLRKKANELQGSLAFDGVVGILKQINAAVDLQKVSLDAATEEAEKFNQSLNFENSARTIKVINAEIKKLEEMRLNVTADRARELKKQIDDLKAELKNFDEVQKQVFRPEAIAPISSLGPSEIPTNQLGLQEVPAQIDQITEKFDEFRSGVLSGADSLNLFSTTLGQALANGAGVFESFKRAALAALSEIAAALIKQAILSLLVTSLLPGLGAKRLAGSLANLGRGGLFGGIFGLDIPGLATGGIVTRPGIFQVGEGGQPEAVIPLDRLNSMINTSNRVEVYGESRIENDQIVIAYRNGTKKNNALYG